MPSVVQDWVQDLPLRQQGVLLLALRGPDGARKESPSKPIVRSMRAAVMNSGRHGVPMEPGETFEGDAFMRNDLIYDGALWSEFSEGFFVAIDELPLHFYQHFIHAAAVLGFNHPVPIVRDRWLAFYHRGCDKLHMNPETAEQFAYRLRDGRRIKEDAA